MKYKNFRKFYSEIPLPSDLLEPWDIRALSIRKTADLPGHYNLGMRVTPNSTLDVMQRMK
jgi:hypothetical protein